MTRPRDSTHAVTRSRYVTKKALRAALAGGASLLGAGAPVLRAGVRVLTYHRFGPSVRDPFCVSTRELDAQLHRLARDGAAVDLASFRDHLTGRAALRDGSVLVTIDDAEASVIKHGLPVFRAYAVPAVVFPIVARIGTAGFVSVADLACMVAAGWSVGSHSHTHRSMARISRDQARDEFQRSRGLLERELGTAVDAFCYPFGTRADFNAATRTLAAEAGYRLAFTSQHGRVRAGTDPLEVPRIKVEGGDPAWVFPALCRGALDGWRLIDHALYRVQRPHERDRD